MKNKKEPKTNTSLRYVFVLDSHWRRQRDSNPRGVTPKRFSRPPRYDRFDMPPYSAIIPQTSMFVKPPQKKNRIKESKESKSFGHPSPPARPYSLPPYRASIEENRKALPKQSFWHQANAKEPPPKRRFFVKTNEVRLRLSLGVLRVPFDIVNIV